VDMVAQRRDGPRWLREHDDDDDDDVVFYAYHLAFVLFFCYFRDTTLYGTRCYVNVLSKADISQLNLPRGTKKNKKKRKKTITKK